MFRFSTFVRGSALPRLRHRLERSRRSGRSPRRASPFRRLRPGRVSRAGVAGAEGAEARNPRAPAPSAKISRSTELGRRSDERWVLADTGLELAVAALEGALEGTRPAHDHRWRGRHRPRSEAAHG